MIASALVGISDSNFTTRLSGILTGQNTKIETCTLGEFIEIMELRTERNNVMSLCSIMNLIGRNVNVPNYPEWKQRRLRSHAAPLMLSPTDTSNFRILPPLDFTMRFYSEVKSFWQIRPVQGTIETARTNRYRNENRYELTQGS